MRRTSTRGQVDDRRRLGLGSVCCACPNKALPGGEAAGREGPYLMRTSDGQSSIAAGAGELTASSGSESLVTAVGPSTRGLSSCATSVDGLGGRSTCRMRLRRSRSLSAGSIESTHAISSASAGSGSTPRSSDLESGAGTSRRFLESHATTAGTYAGIGVVSPGRTRRLPIVRASELERWGQRGGARQRGDGVGRARSCKQH
eukprot:scaffold157099_cov32-Tisochrysis_lutea.AAC.4